MAQEAERTQTEASANGAAKGQRPRPRTSSPLVKRSARNPKSPRSGPAFGAAGRLAVGACSDKTDEPAGARDSSAAQDWRAGARADAARHAVTPQIDPDDAS